MKLNNPLTLTCVIRWPDGEFLRAASQAEFSNDYAFIDWTGNEERAGESLPERQSHGMLVFCMECIAKATGGALEVAYDGVYHDENDVLEHDPEDPEDQEDGES